ncbi:MAG: AI-2E family transporter [Candidatus Nanopelagicales bacterium]|jgi:predicted PurR-regulated permease PerM|nr:AI-2E family transporter [Candidatus Nanopelagicales bacterium]
MEQPQQGTQPEARSSTEGGPGAIRSPIAPPHAPPTTRGRPPAAEGDRVPDALRTAAAWSWRILVVLALGAVVLLVTARLQVLFVALFVALLLTALLEPPARRLRRAGVPNALATAAVLLGAVAAVVGVLYLVGRAVLAQMDAFSAAVTEGIATLQAWVDSTFGLSIPDLWSRVSGLLGVGGQGGGITSSVFGAASTAVEVVGGAGLALFATIFFVHDGAGIWRWVARLFPGGVRRHVDTAGDLSWQTLSAYARGTVLIAAIDAIGIGIGVAVIGVPLALPIGVLVFFGSFVPIVGALVSGFVAVVIALATVGLTGALLTLAVVIAVQQIEGNVLQPLIQSRMVALHPLAVVLAVAAGSVLAGLVGAVIAVPIVAVVNVMVRYARRVARGEADEETAAAGVGAPVGA